MGDTRASNIPPIIIPKDSVLLISDNRDNAQDGRFLGFTHKNRVVGKVLYTWWGKSKKRINIDLTKR